MTLLVRAIYREDLKDKVIRNPVGLGLSIGSMGLNHCNSIGLDC